MGTVDTARADMGLTCQVACNQDWRMWFEPASTMCLTITTFSGIATEGQFCVHEPSNQKVQTRIGHPLRNFNVMPLRSSTDSRSPCASDAKRQTAPLMQPLPSRANDNHSGREVLTPLGGARLGHRTPAPDAAYRPPRHPSRWAGVSVTSPTSSSITLATTV